MSIETIRRSTTSFEVTARETLTTRDAERIVTALAREPRGTIAIIDLRGAHRCEPAALLTLTRALAESGAPHVILGLTRAHQRLLRYLEPAASASSPV